MSKTMPKSTRDEKYRRKLQLKSMSSHHFKKKFKFIKTMYLDGGIWSVGYFSSTIGLNEEQIKKYIVWQGQKDLPQKTTLGF